MEDLKFSVMSLSKHKNPVSATKQMINDLVVGRIISEPGGKWMTLALDPYHDTPVEDFHGVPDQEVGKSVCYAVTQEYQISKNNSPVALPPGNWSCRVASFPIITPFDVKDGLFYGDVVTQSTTAHLLNPVQVNYAVDGANFPDTAVPGLPGNPQGCSLPSIHTKGIIKIAGCGIEIVNTTAQINLQGLMSMCRMSQPDAEPYHTYVALTSPANAWGTTSVTPIRTVPKNLSEMALYPGFAQDLAANGYYAPVFLKVDRHLHYPTPTGGLLLTEDPAGGPVDVLTPIPCYSNSLSSFLVPGNTTPFYTMRNCPIFNPSDSNVVIFSGLSEETTLTLRVRWIVERFPSDSESELLPIATSTAPFDPVALEIYSRVTSKLPAGVPFGENPAGEWWSHLLGSIAEVVGPIISMIPHPLAKAAGVAITGSGAALNRYTDDKTDMRMIKNASGYYGDNARKNMYGKVVPVDRSKPMNRRYPKRKKKQPAVNSIEPIKGPVPRKNK
jgi:hypothetical protein